MFRKFVIIFMNRRQYSKIEDYIWCHIIFGVQQYIGDII